MGIKERQERERETVRQSILEAARDLFIREGYPHVTIRRIAERIEYSPAAIYGYFPSKDDIFFALAAEGFELLHQVAQGQPTSANPLDTLRSRLWGIYEFSKAHPEHFVLMFMDRSVPRIGAQYQQFSSLVEEKRCMAELVAACVADGQLPAGTEPMSAFRVLSAALLGAAGTRVFNRLAPGESADALARDVMDLVIAGLRSGAPMTFQATAPGCPVLPDESEAPAETDAAARHAL